MIKPALLVVLGTGTAVAGKPAMGQVDGWTGPLPTMAAATGIKDPSELPPMPDLPDAISTPVTSTAEWKDRFPIDEVHAAVRGNAWRLVAHTAAGWFVSPALGGGDGQSHCYVESATVYGQRVAIGFGCSVGGVNGSNNADKLFSLYCGVDAAGRPGCGSTVISAHNNVHQGSKGGGTDTVHDTISCLPSFQDDAITLAAVEPADDDGGATFKHELAPCVPETQFPLSAHSYSTRSAKSLRFNANGRWR